MYGRGNLCRNRRSFGAKTESLERDLGRREGSFEAKREYGSFGLEDQGMLLHGDIIKSAEQVAYLGSTEQGRGETER